MFRLNPCAVPIAAMLLLASSAAAPAQAQTARGRAAASARTPDFEPVRRMVQTMIAEQGLPSVSIAVAKDGRIIWEEAFGWADRERMVEATPHTMYSLASISKPMTATAIARLAEMGRIDLDRPVNDYLGDARLTSRGGDATRASVRHVLAHTAGLPLHYQFFYENAGYGRPAMRETIARYGFVATPPGENYQYSNLGYGILDDIVSRVSGVSYADYMRMQIFLPLGMLRTSVGIGPGLKPYVAQRYDSRQRPIPFYDFDHPGGSAVYSSAHDLVRFGMYHIGERLPGQGRILSDTMRLAMQRVLTPGSPVSGYGMGWGVTADDNGLRRISHSGGMPGVSTLLNMYPSERLVVVVMTNAMNRSTGRIAEEIAAAVVPRYAAERETRRRRQDVANGAGAAGRPGTPGAPHAAPPASLLGEWIGSLRTYDGDVPLRLLVQPDGDVHVRLGGELRTLLNDVQFREVSLSGRFAGTIPTEDARRHAHTIRLDLRLGDGRLQGQASAQTGSDPLYWSLASYVELVRASEGAAIPAGP